MTPHVRSDIGFALIDAEATDLLGAALAHAFPGTALRSAGLYLDGDLGAGKTTCVRSLLRALGVVGLIRSPTFTLVETYALDGLTCVHADLYRLGAPAEVEELGLRDFLEAGYLLLIEWPSKAAEALPPPDLRISLSFAAAGRIAQVSAHGAFGETWLDNLRNDTRLTPYLVALT